jgi:hypothetical protein
VLLLLRWWRGAARADRLRVAAACLAAVLLTGGYELRKEQEPKSPAPGLPTTGVAADLTAIQLGHHPGPRNAMLRRIDSLLELLEADCPGDTRTELGSLTVDSIRRLRQAGVQAAPNGVLGGVVGSTTIGSTAHCSGFFARYVARARRESATVVR